MQPVRGGFGAELRPCMPCVTALSNPENRLVPRLVRSSKDPYKDA